MTTITADLIPERDLTHDRNPALLFLTDVWVLLKRAIARIRNEPETLMDVTIMPVIFILMFTYVFGGAIGLPGGGSSTAEPAWPGAGPRSNQLARNGSLSGGTATPPSESRPREMTWAFTPIAAAG